MRWSNIAGARCTPPAPCASIAGTAPSGCSCAWSTSRRRIRLWEPARTKPSGALRILAEDLVHCADDDARVLAGDAVVDGFAAAPRRDQSVRPQPRELLRHRRLAQSERALDLGHRLFALAQDAQDHQSAFVRQRLEELARFLGLGGHAVEIRCNCLQADSFVAHVVSAGWRAGRL